MSPSSSVPVALSVIACRGPLDQEAVHLNLAPDPQLVAEGWERRFTADPVRARDAFQLYQALGFEVRAEKIQPSEFSTACGDCRLAMCSAYVTIYTRRPAGAE
jgi:hypothetical protein